MFDTGMLYRAASHSFSIFMKLVFLLANPQNGPGGALRWPCPRLWKSSPIKWVSGLAELWSKTGKQRNKETTRDILLESPYKIKSTQKHDSHEEHSIFSLLSLDSCAVSPTVLFSVTMPPAHWIQSYLTAIKLCSYSNWKLHYKRTYVSILIKEKAVSRHFAREPARKLVLM